MSARKKLLLALLALAAVFFVGAGGYRVIEEDVSFGDAAYMTIITISTVGLGEEWELSSAGKVWTSLIIVFGILVVALAFAALQAMIVGGQLRSVLGRRKLQNQIAKISGHYIVCGYGRVGRLIAENLRHRGEKVVVIDRDDKRTVLAEETGTPYVLGDATDEDVLHSAGLERAAGLVTSLAGDADNVFVALTANGIRKEMPIIARAEHFDSEPKLKRAGATHVVCPQAIGATRMANLLARPAIAHLVDITTAGSEWELDEVLVAPDSRMVGQSLQDLKLRERCNAMVVAITGADGTTKVNPGPEHVVSQGDALVVIGPSGIANALMDFQAPGRGRHV